MANRRQPQLAASFITAYCSSVKARAFCSWRIATFCTAVAEHRERTIADMAGPELAPGGRDSHAAAIARHRQNGLAPAEAQRDQVANGCRLLILIVALQFRRRDEMSRCLPS